MLNTLQVFNPSICLGIQLEMVAHLCRVAKIVFRNSTEGVLVAWETLHRLSLAKASQTLPDGRWVSGTTNLN